ncbi:MAG: hypothetical protein ABW190_16785 [Rhizobacter sp.]
MTSLVALTSGSPLPSAIDGFIKRGASYGPPLPLAKMNVHVPAKPIVMDNGGAYTMTLHGGPTLSFSVAPKLGTLVDTSA